MTRLETQIFDKQNELNQLKSFAEAKMKIFNSQLPTIKRILKTYKVENINTDNCFVDFAITDGKPIFRMYLKVGLQLLSDRQLKNLESKLRGSKIPMPTCPVSLTSINLCYYD